MYVSETTEEKESTDKANAEILALASEMETFRQQRTIDRDELWIRHMRQKAYNGIWHSSKRSRTGLPDANNLSDVARLKALKRLVADGRLEKIKKGQYKIKETNK